MRLIDADALMQSLGITDPDCPKCKWYDKSSRRCSRGGDFEDACCAIDDAPTIEPELNWIPCSERLPEYGVSALTYDGQCFCVENRIPNIRDEEGEPITGDWWVSDD